MKTYEPAAWPQVPVRRLFTVRGGATPRGDEANWDGPHVWLTPEDLSAHDGATVVASRRRLTDAGLATCSAQLSPPGSLVVSSRAPIGYVVETRCWAATNQGCMTLVPRPQLDTRYFRYQLLVSRATLEALGQGATFVEIASDSLRSFRLVAPPLEAQQRVANFLDREIDQIDELVVRKQALLALLEQRISTIVAGGGALASLEFSRDGLPIPPSEYPIVQLGRVARIQSGVTLHAGRPPTTEDETVPYLRVANVQTGFLDLAEIKEVTVPRRMAEAARLQRGDVLMTEGGDPDKLGRGTVWRGEIANCIHQNHIFAIRPDRNRLLPEYLSLMTRTPYARAYFEATASKTTGIASTNTRKIAAWPVPVPALDVQAGLVQQARDEEECTTEVANEE